MTTLAGKVAVVTGGGSGLGAAICRALFEQGVRVVIADIKEPAAPEDRRGTEHSHPGQRARDATGRRRWHRRRALQDPANVAQAVIAVLQMPAWTVIPEIMLLPRRESSWP